MTLYFPKAVRMEAEKVLSFMFPYNEEFHTRFVEFSERRQKVEENFS